MVGGYISGFERVFDPSGFCIPEQEVRNSEAINQWVLHTARESLKDAGMYRPGEQQNKTALMLRLSLPTSRFSNYCQSVWKEAQLQSGAPGLYPGGCSDGQESPGPGKCGFQP